MRRTAARATFDNDKYHESESSRQFRDEPRPTLPHPYTNLKPHQSKGPLIITNGRGVYVYDDQGKEYIEGLAGLWCVSLGFSEPRLVEAARRQMEALPYYHAFASKSHGPAIDLAERILDLLPETISKVFFNNSGSEANDTAIKMV